MSSVFEWWVRPAEQPKPDEPEQPCWAKVAISKAVAQYTMDNEFVQSYPSLRAAADALGRTSITPISRALHNPTSRTAFGFRWRFVDD